MMYVKPKRLRDRKEEPERVKDVDNSMGKENIHTVKLSLGMKFFSIFLAGTGLILTFTWIGVEGLVKWQNLTDEIYFARHNVLEVRDESGYKTKAVKFTFSFPITIEPREDKVEYIAITSGTQSANKVANLSKEEKEEIIKNSGLSKILTGVWILETGKGENTNESAHHNECSKVGMTNEFGYRALDDYCFNSFEESVETVTKWFEEQLKTKTLNASLCFYNHGKATQVCSYSLSFADLEKDGKLAVK